MSSATTSAAFSANTPAFAIGIADDVAHRIHVRERRHQVVAVDRDPAVLGEARLPDHGRHAVDRDPDEQVVGEPLAALEHGLLGRTASSSTTRFCARYSMSRAASSSRKRCETSGVTGTGADIGAMIRISVCSRMPRSTSWSWSRNAPSNGAGGHLYGWPRNADQDRPDRRTRAGRRASARRRRSSSTRGRPPRSRGSRRGRTPRRARRRGCRRRTSRRRS